MSHNLVTLADESRKMNLISEPVFYRLTNSKDKEELNLLLKSNSSIMVYDELYGQVLELVKSRNPKRKNIPEKEMKELINQHLGIISMTDYGVWVFYPWSNRLVHILDEDEFIEVRTNRNIYKITPEERNVLAKKKIGVIGLSVGQAVSVTVAMERGAGEIRLADFDLLELTNMNRIRTGVHTLNVPKAISVAREIAEIDPYIKTVCFLEGVNEDNIDQFFCDGGVLDLVVDECDGLDIKILARYKAKELKVPVVMEASDRCTLDIERFDLEPDRAILHGLIDHLDHSKLKNLRTNEEKIPYILPMLGTHTISKRMKASMVEIEQSITTWPQLSSAVAMGGAISADVIRRIFLNQFQQSGRYFIDLEELVGEPNYRYQSVGNYNYSDELELLSLDEMIPVCEEICKKDIPEYCPSEKVITELVEYASQAPSVGNNQPWRWLYKKGKLFLFHERSKTESLADLNQVGSNVTFGACLENLKLAANQQGLFTKVKSFPKGPDNILVCTIDFIKSKGTEVDSLFNFINKRCTNRRYSERTSIHMSKLDKISECVKIINGAKVQFAHSEDQLSELEEILGITDKIRFMHPRGHYDFFKKEIRWNEKEVNETRDGLDLDTLDFSPSERAGLEIAKDPDVIQYLTEWKGGGAFEKMSRKAVQSASAIGFITMPSYTPLDFLKGGAAMQRAWLSATAQKISFQPILAPLFMFNLLLRSEDTIFSHDTISELADLRTRFGKIFDISDSNAEVFLFRLFNGEEPKRSLRKPVSEVLNFI